jgi:hypothetical protein
MRSVTDCLPNNRNAACHCTGKGFFVMFGAHEVIHGRKQNLRKENDVHKTCARKA